MSVPIQTIEESLSVAHISAIIAKSGAAMNIIDRDFGVDVTVRRIDSINGARMDMGAVFDCQLKATINWRKNNGNVVYDLDATTYNKLIYRHLNASTPCFLVVLCLPRDERRWLEINEDSMLLRECCYYHFINGATTNNTSTVRIHIPENQKLTPRAVQQLIDLVEDGGFQ